MKQKNYEFYCLLSRHAAFLKPREKFLPISQFWAFFRDSIFLFICFFLVLKLEFMVTLFIGFTGNQYCLYKYERKKKARQVSFLPLFLLVYSFWIFEEMYLCSVYLQSIEASSSRYWYIKICYAYHQCKYFIRTNYTHIYQDMNKEWMKSIATEAGTNKITDI